MTAATIRIRPSCDDDAPALFAIWLAAVRATHDFLTEEDIGFYAELVRDQYLPTARLLVAANGVDAPVGFMGMTGGNIDTLFIDPVWHGKGIGRALVARALGQAAKLTVDVNEQNRAARAFYERLGFRMAGRSALDESGRPFPILHLTLDSFESGEPARQNQEHPEPAGHRPQGTAFVMNEGSEFRAYDPSAIA